MAADVSKSALQATQQDPDSGLVAQSCFDLLLIELVPMANRIAAQLHSSSLPQVHRTGTTASKPSTIPLDPDELRDATFYRLEAMGHRVGAGIAESLSANHPLLPTALPYPPSSTEGSAHAGAHPSPSPAAALDTMKFLCKEIWTALFRKQIDNLKTNHRGVFVLTDNRFEPLRRCSLPAASAAAGTGGGVVPGGGGPDGVIATKGGAEEATRRAAPFLYFPTGVIRGVLSSLGIEAQVSAEVAGVGLPAAVFTIRSAGAR